MAEETSTQTPTYEDIYNKVTDIVTNHLCINEEENGYDTSFPFESFGADDLDHDELIMQVEDAFNLEFDDAECANVHNTLDLIRIVAAAYDVEVPEDPDIIDEDEQDEIYPEEQKDGEQPEEEVETTEPSTEEQETPVDPAQN